MNTVVVGYLNTDIVATGIKQFPKPGEHVYAKELKIGPGGKPRNIADMIARLAPKDSVAVVGKTVKDPYGLWRVPLDSLADAGVNTDHIVIADYAETQKMPGIALIPVNEQGRNQIIVAPGINNDFNPMDIDIAAPLFRTAGENNGMLVLTLECPLDTAIHAAKLAHKHGLKVMFDPGGIEAGTAVSQLVQSGIYLIKPNEHETKVLTGIDVTDFGSARQAAGVLHKQGIENILITVGANGAYLFTKHNEKHIPVPKIQAGNQKDETGCGDQTMAALCALTQQGRSIEEAAELAILAGTLQFYRHGIQPVTAKELNQALR